jgi:hypothetical protein
MTTVAKNEEGQSVFEFLLMLPVMIGLVMLMIRVNSAIQISIVDQQYGRAQALFLTFDSPVFPQISQRVDNLDSKNYNQIVMGVSDNLTASNGGTYVPEASTQNVARNLATAALGNNDPQTEPNPDQGGLRALVRVRNSVSLCTQLNVVQQNGGFAVVHPISPTALSSLPVHGAKGV